MSRTLLPAHVDHNKCFVAHANRRGEETVNGRALAGSPGNSGIGGPQGDVMEADPKRMWWWRTRRRCGVARGEPTRLPGDGVPTADGDTHPMGTRHLEDLRPELYSWD